MRHIKTSSFYCTCFLFCRKIINSSSKKEIKSLKTYEKAIVDIEKQIKDDRAALKIKTDELEFKIQLKRVGGDEFKAESLQLIQKINKEVLLLKPEIKEEKKKLNALNKDKAVIEARIAKTDGILKSIGGQLTDEQAKELILKKLYDFINQELTRYLNAEKRIMTQSVENLWDKYAVSKTNLEIERVQTLDQLDVFLKGLGYLV